MLPVLPVAPFGSWPAGYLDATFGEPLHPKAREILLAASDQAWADPAGLTPPSRQARTLIDAAIDQLGSLLGVRRDRISLVPDALTAQLSRLEGRIVHSAVERSEVLQYGLEHGGHVVSVDRLGRINVEQLEAVVSNGDEIVMQAANAEVGTIQPLSEIVEIAKRKGARVHSDYSQSIGRVPILDSLSSVSANATSWNGPRGIGIVISEQQQHSPNISVPLALASAAALEGWLDDEASEGARLRQLVDQLRARLAQIPNVDVVGDPHDRLPHILTASFLYVDGQRLMDELGRLGIYVGSGSACTASRIEPSHVLAAMGALTHGNLRLVLPHGVNASDVQRLIDVLPEIVERVRDDLR